MNELELIKFQATKLLDACDILYKLNNKIKKEKKSNYEIISKNIDETYIYIKNFTETIIKEIEKNKTIIIDYKKEKIDYNKKYNEIFYKIDLMMYESIITMGKTKEIINIIKNTNINVHKPEEYMVKCRNLLNK